MRRHALRAVDFIDHMLEAVHRIETYTQGQNREDFLASPLVQDAVVRNFEILGEASKKLLDVLPDAAARFPDSVRQNLRN